MKENITWIQKRLIEEEILGGNTPNYAIKKNYDRIKAEIKQIVVMN